MKFIFCILGGIAAQLIVTDLLKGTPADGYMSFGIGWLVMNSLFSE